MINFSAIDVGLPHKKYLDKIRIWLSNVIIEEGKILGELNYVFCTDEHLHKINLEFLDHDTYTDIITFPATEDNEIISSEIYISLDRIKDNSHILNTNHNSELLRVIVHGVLHLIGYDDKSDEESKLMRIKENLYINKFVNI